jgi:hypothetical protein
MSLLLMMLLAVAPQKPATAALKPLPVVTVDVMQAMLPQAEGWTRAPLTGDVVRVSDDSGYSFAVADFAKGSAKLRLTIGDTVGVGDCLMALAGMISVLPEGYSEKPAPATAILRFTYEGYQAASKWNAEKFSGEFSVLVADRFVVKAEGEGVESLDSLRAFVSKVDFAKLAALKTAK